MHIADRQDLGTYAGWTEADLLLALCSFGLLADRIGTMLEDIPPDALQRCARQVYGSDAADVIVSVVKMNLVNVVDPKMFDMAVEEERMAAAF